MKARIWEIEGTMAHAQRRAIVEALEACDGSPGKAAARLKIGRSTVYRLIDIYAVSVRGGDAKKARTSVSQNGAAASAHARNADEGPPSVPSD